MADQSLDTAEIPIATLSRLIKSSIPDNMQVAKETKAAFQKACTIFIIYLTANANAICKTRKRTTIQTNDILEALAQMNFEEFLPEIKNFLDLTRPPKTTNTNVNKKRSSPEKAAIDKNEHNDEKDTKKSKLTDNNTNDDIVESV